MKCPACGQDNRENSMFCGECATPLAAKLICTRCGGSNPLGQKFCDSCAHPLGEVQRMMPSPPVALLIANQPISFALGRYQVEKFLGEGGKKRVYLAHDSVLDRDVALAVIKRRDWTRPPSAE